METKQGFIPRLVQHLAQASADERSQGLLILPSRRAMVFIQQEMSNQFPAGWLPKMQVIDEFINGHSKLKASDPLVLLFELYRAYADAVKKPEEFQDYLRWGGLLLAEFVEIDKFLCNAKALFNHVKEAKLMEKWSPDQEPGQMMQDFAEFFAFQGELYQVFEERLLKSGIGHQGMLIRDLAESKENGFDQLSNKYKKVWFAGFNALNPAEQALIRKLQKSVSVEMLWDLDAYYLQDNQEAGKFLKEQIKYFGAKPNIAQDFKERKELTELICPNEYSQAKAVGSVVDELLKEGAELSSIAVVLADEGLLEPCLSSLPESVDKINVSMGYPIQQTLHFRLFYAAITAYRNSKRKNPEAKKLQYYYKNVLQVVENPLLAAFTEGEQGKHFTNWLDKIRSSNVPYLGLSFLTKLWEGAPAFISQLSLLIPETQEDGENLISNLDAWLDLWVNKQFESDSPDEFGLEAAAQVKQMLNRLVALKESYADLLDEEGLYYLWQQIASMYQLSFIGEPLEGLQVMGVLETRLLHFKHVIMVSSNEGKIPSNRRESPFIPYDIKKAHGLPRFEYREALYANHFYRLVQHAEKTFFIYHTDASGGKGEPSRFIRQLVHELPAYSGKVVYKKRLYELQNLPSNPDEIRVENKGDIQQNYLSFMQRERALSPSSLAKFQSCSLKFYWEKLARLRETDEVREDLEADLFGTLVHGCLERIYEGSKVVDKERLLNGIKQVDSFLDLALDDLDIEKTLVKEGSNEIVMELAKLQLIDFLKLEIEALETGKLEIIGLEEQLSGTIEVDGLKVGLFGFADRIDRFNGQVRVIDYKTGAVKDESLVWKINAENDWQKQDKALQLMSYLYLLDQNRAKYGIKPDEPLQASIATLKSAGDHFKTLQVSISKNEKVAAFTPELLTDLGKVLKGLVSEMLVIEAFEQREEDSVCGYCAYNAACKRVHMEKQGY